MKANIKIAVAAIGGLVVGGGLSSGIDINPGVLHAQAAVPYYEVVEISVKDQVGYEKSGVDKVRDATRAGGGKVLAGGYNKAHGLIGAPPANRFLIVAYPSKEVQEKVWADSVKPWMVGEAMKYADFRAVGLEGIEQK
jgi:hypothetical protein